MMQTADPLCMWVHRGVLQRLTSSLAPHGLQCVFKFHTGCSRMHSLQDAFKPITRPDLLTHAYFAGIVQ